MEKTILISGLGGQGAQTLGKLLLYAADAAGRNVSFFPAYGAQKRGGVSDCTLVISDGPVYAPCRRTYDCVVALCEASCEKYAGTVKAGGMLCVNSSLVTGYARPEGSEVYEIPLNELVAHIDNPRAINVILLGFLTKRLALFSEAAAKRVVMERFGENKELAAINGKAFDMGAAYGA